MKEEKLIFQIKSLDEKVNRLKYFLEKGYNVTEKIDEQLVSSVRRLSKILKIRKKREELNKNEKT